jgi:hypothetical protein
MAIDRMVHAVSAKSGNTSLLLSPLQESDEACLRGMGRDATYRFGSVTRVTAGDAVPLPE